MIESTTIKANGLTFAADVAGAGEVTALLLHGFPECRASWTRQLGYMGQLGWRGVAPDLRGYGGTTRPPGKAAYALDRLTDDIAALFTTLGGRRKVLIGHDWGGIIAWQTALRGKVHLDGLIILNAPHPAIFAKVLRKSWVQKRRSWYVALFQIPGLPEWLMTRNGGAAIPKMFRDHGSAIEPELVDTLRRNALQPGAATAMMNYYRANVTGLGGDDWTDQTLHVPTLMIWGEKDVALDIALTEGNEAYVEDFTLRRLPNATHWVQQDAPEEVNRLITAWAREKGLA